jgi:hypothetical protein
VGDVQVFVSKTFRRFQRKEGIGDHALLQALERAGAGLIDADLRQGLIKQRVARTGQGRSGGYRTIIAYRLDHRAVFLFGFAKSALANIDGTTLEHWQAIGADLMAADEKSIKAAISSQELHEVTP